MIALAVIFLILWLFLRHPAFVVLAAIFGILGVVWVLTDAAGSLIGW